MTKPSSPVICLAAGAATLLFSQSLIPVARAQPVRAPDYRVQVKRQKAVRSFGGLVITGRVTNTGRKPLTYTQVVPVLFDASGKAVYQGSGYLTASPLLPGQSADFRACEIHAPTFHDLHLAFRESGMPVQVEEAQEVARRL